MPGSGKTTLGRALAEKLELLFIDLDAEIERLEQQSIDQIFALKGEPFFRQAEAAVLRQVSKAHSSFVMATGGGTPCFYDGIEFMNSMGITVFLNVPVNILAERLSNSETIRPVFQKTSNINETLNQLQSLRLKFYTQATHQVSGPDVSKLTQLLKA